MGTRENEGLQLLGKKTTYPTDYSPEVLESFENKHQENDYWVEFKCPEFTSLCPKSLSNYRSARLCRNQNQVHSRCSHGGKQKFETLFIQLPQSR